MTNSKNYYTQRNCTDHSTFGGLIYNYDFDGYNSMSQIADRIISDQKFDRYCETQAKLRERSQKIDRQYQKLQKKGTN